MADRENWKVPKSFRLDRGLDEALTKKAEEEKRSKSAVVSDAIEAYLAVRHGEGISQTTTVGPVDQGPKELSETAKQEAQEFVMPGTSGPATCSTCGANLVLDEDRETGWRCPDESKHGGARIVQPTHRPRPPTAEDALARVRQLRGS